MIVLKNFKMTLCRCSEKLLKRLLKQFDKWSLVRHRTGFDVLSVHGDEKEAKKKVEEILQQTRGNADDWFY